MTTQGIETLRQPGTLAKQAYGSIRQAIRNRVLVQGELYSENELAESLGISRTPVREALIELSREGLVEIVRQRGFRLREMGPVEQAEVFSLRLVLETFVVRRLAEAPDPDQVKTLRTILDSQLDSSGDSVTFLSFDESFHLTMPELAGLDRTRQMLATLRGAMWLIASTALLVSDREQQIVAEHQAIVDAIEQGDPDAAEAAMRVHLDITATAAAEAFHRH